MITAGSANVAVEKTGMSSTEPTAGPPLRAGAAPLPPRYDDAIERMSIRPEPSPPPCWAPPPDDGAAAALGRSLAIAARLLSENSTEFSLRWPRIAAADDDDWAGAAAAARPPPNGAASGAGGATSPNRSPPSSAATAAALAAWA